MGVPSTPLIHLSPRQQSGYIDNFGGSSRLVDHVLFLTSGSTFARVDVPRSR